ncbi:MAG: glycerol-3-phosphate 1-O-acyltransferase PlsY [Myxococcota bacterium]|nr:glycerol-3-phosphate 1-O-acyltransferase PlsY [Myxococcota bacterium]
MMTFLFYLCSAYLIGSIPFGVFWSMGLSGRDPRQLGSHNIGMTNVWRVSGPYPGGLTLICDVFKSALLIWMCPSEWTPDQLAWIGLMAVLGHCYSAYLNFSGGKGVATAAGVLLSLSSGMFAISIGVWIAVRLMTGASSIASLTAVLVCCMSSFWLWPASMWPLFIILGIISVRHRDNIVRIRDGTELDGSNPYQNDSSTTI